MIWMTDIMTPAVSFLVWDLENFKWLNFAVQSLPERAVYIGKLLLDEN